MPTTDAVPDVPRLWLAPSDKNDAYAFAVAIATTREEAIAKMTTFLAQTSTGLVDVQWVGNYLPRIERLEAIDINQVREIKGGVFAAHGS